MWPFTVSTVATCLFIHQLNQISFTNDNTDKKRTDSLPCYRLALTGNKNTLCYFVNIEKNKENLQTIAKLIGRLANESAHASLLHLLLKALKSPFVRLSALQMMILRSALVRDREIFKIFNRPNLVFEVQMFTTAQFCQVSARNTSLEIQVLKQIS